MRKPIKHKEEFDDYFLANYKEVSLHKMCEICGISKHKGYRILKKLGIERDKDLIAKFKGHKNHNEQLDQYFKDNYLLKPLKHLCADKNVSVKVGERIMKRLNLVRPKQLVLKFMSTHKPVSEHNKHPKKYYVPVKVDKRRIPKAKVKKLKVDKVQKPEKVLPTRVVDYSTKVLVKIDHKTWVYRDKTA